MHYQNKLLETAKSLIIPQKREGIIIERAKIQTFILNMAKEGLTSKRYGHIHEANRTYLEKQGFKISWTNGEQPPWVVWTPGYIITIPINDEDLEEAIPK